MAGLAITITVDPASREALRAKLEPRNFARIVFEIARKAAQAGAREVRAYHWDVGATAASATAEERPFGARVVVKGLGARVVEYGRHPGGTPPPLAAIRDWAGRHGVQGLEVPIARAIARRGMKGRFFMKRTRRRLRQVVIPRLIREAVFEIKTRWGL